ncbi:rod-binding protein [Gluconacetobacter tumulicola]|uniref:Chemotaxis protein n=1 Tax=Gluconacetobacter tumulicola TaxID=1017177 RepID=A0A7W4P524_9PROT|nr:rod-binding protein [Gluconacetobacter tumulicola]MBB2177866.1 chemotaxis protein [Gluconacetobacter tumulicola]
MSGVGSVASSLSVIGRQQMSAGQPDSTQTEQARKAAVSFESVTIGELLQPMFDTVDTSDGMFGGGAAEKQFRSLQVLELGKQIANNGGIGIADSVYRQILAMQEQAQAQKETSQS